MNKTAIIVFLSFMWINFTKAQNRGEYDDLISEAWSLYKKKDFLNSAKKYSDTFNKFGGTINDRYIAACSWALANVPDSAFVQLFKIVKYGTYNSLDHISKETDLSSLHSDIRWTEVIEIVKENKEKEDQILNKNHIAILDTIHEEDQKYRKQLQNIQDKYGWDSKEMQTHWATISKVDSLNLIKIKKILDQWGWLGEEEIGEEGNTTLFLVIQHSDQKTQEMYLPMMRNAVSKGKAKARHLALLEDRVAIGKGQKQIYGSQIGQDHISNAYYVLPLIDPVNVDKRRAEVGLESMENYISNWGLIWNSEDYLKNLPIYEERQKKNN
jgi:hypothetical protein